MYVKWVKGAVGPYFVKTMNSYTRVSVSQQLCARVYVYMLGLGSHKE